MLDRKLVSEVICQKMASDQRGYTLEELVSAVRERFGQDNTGTQQDKGSIVAMLCDTLSALHSNSAIEIIKGGQSLAAPRLTPENIHEHVFRIIDQGIRNCRTPG